MNITYLKSQIKYVNEYEENFLKSNEERAFIIPLYRTEAIYGAWDSCNINYCEENNIPYVHQKTLHGGGCIIGVKGNIFVDAQKKNTFRNNIYLSKDFANTLCGYLKEKGLNSVKCDNNDVMVDGFKVASGVEIKNGDFKYMGYQISIYQDLETIKHVCNKPMIKIPKALSEYGITTEDMIYFCDKYFKEL